MARRKTLKTFVPITSKNSASAQMTMKNVFTRAGVDSTRYPQPQKENSASASYIEKLHKARTKYLILYKSFTTFECGEFIFIFHVHCIRFFVFYKSSKNDNFAKTLLIDNFEIVSSTIIKFAIDNEFC
jgi:hypothetical protein